VTARAREELIAAARHLSGSGLSPGSSGNLSVRLGGSILVTPTGSSLSRVAAGDLVDTGDPASTPRASKELPLHEAVYRALPEALAIVHLHSPYATAASCLTPDADGNCPIPVLTPYQGMRFPTIPVASYARPGSDALADAVGRTAARSAALLMANHGLVAGAASLDAAVDLAEELEAAARVFFLLQDAGARGYDIVPLTARQRAEL
jgi:ribulose-5-phosphate 4-epimerase/fuculose-1-phosphate aldolase